MNVEELILQVPVDKFEIEFPDPPPFNTHEFATTEPVELLTIPVDPEPLPPVIVEFSTVSVLLAL